MWQPYLKVLAEQAGGAIHVLDRFHIMKQLGEAIDDVRAGEARRMKQDGYEPLLKHSRWCLLKRPENLTDRQTVKLTRTAEVQPAKRCGPTCIARTSSASGNINRPLGPANSSTSGAVE